MDPKVFWRVEVRSFLGDRVLCEVREVQINTVSQQGAGSLCACRLGAGRAWMLPSATAQLMSTAAFLPSMCEQLGKQAREDEGAAHEPSYCPAL